MRWLRFSGKQTIGFGFIEGDAVRACRGEMFGAHQPTGELIPLADIRWETPCLPTKMSALWNNFHAAAAKFSLDIPAEPLFFIKRANSFCAHGAEVPAPKSYSGRVLYEGELGVVIGKQGRNIALADAA